MAATVGDNSNQADTDTISTDHVSLLNGAAITPAVGTPKVQRVKVAFGDDNTARDASTAFPLPVTKVDVTSTGTLAIAAATVAIAMNGQAGVSVQLSGTWVGTVTWEGTVNGTTWQAVNAVAASTSAPQSTTTVNGLYRLTPSGLSQVRANMTAFTSGSATVDMRASAGAGGIYANQVLPTKLVDATTAANQATVKAASTPAVAVDTALVVALHPQTTVRPVTSSTGTITSVVAAAASTSLLGATPGRLGAVFFNESTATMYLALSGTASLTAYTVQVAGGGFYELPDLGTIYTGPVSAIWSAANGNVRVTELT